MQKSTIIVLACLIAVAVASTYERYQNPAVESLQESIYDTPVHDRSPRTKRGLLLLKKKLLLTALGLKAAKIGAVGAVGAGVVGALALKSKAAHHHHPTTYVVHGHSW